MGFPLVRCQKALLATGNSDPEAAMEWLFAHMDDPGTCTPLARKKQKQKQITVCRRYRRANRDPAERWRWWWRWSRTECGASGHVGRDGLFACASAQGAVRDGACARCPGHQTTYSLTHSQSGDVERAVEWLFSHPDDTGEDNAPLPAVESSSTAVQQRVPVRYRLRAFVSHKGPSVHSGHYVAHIRTDDVGWVLFNDEKVVRADPESVRALKALAYLYVFERDAA